MATASKKATSCCIGDDSRSIRREAVAAASAAPSVAAAAAAAVADVEQDWSGVGVVGDGKKAALASLIRPVEPIAGASANASVKGVFRFSIFSSSSFISLHGFRFVCGSWR